MRRHRFANTIAGTYPGTGDGGSTDAFNPQRQELQRAGLALVNGVVYVDLGCARRYSPYHGWVMGYSYNGAAFTEPLC